MELHPFSCFLNRRRRDCALFGAFDIYSRSLTPDLTHIKAPLEESISILLDSSSSSYFADQSEESVKLLIKTQLDLYVLPSRLYLPNSQAKRVGLKSGQLAQPINRQENSKIRHLKVLVI